MDERVDARTVAVLGTGTMGLGMASSLLRAGVTVRAWNRNPERAEPLRAEGAHLATTAAEAVEGANVVLTMLFDADAVIEVMSAAAPAMAADALWLQTATVGLDGVARVAILAEAEALAVLDAPVLGSKEPAAKGALTVLVGGDRALGPTVQPVLDAIGSRTIWAGDELGQGTALKLACNAWVASLTAATAQSLSLASGLAVDPQLFLDAIRGGPLDCGYAHAKGNQMLSHDNEPSFGLDGMRKDLDLISAAAAKAGVDRSLLSALAQVFAAASAAGHGKHDIAAVISTFEADLDATQPT